MEAIELSKTPAKPVVLCVDDESEILSSLNRLFRRKGYSVITAESAAKGLQLMEAESVDLIISDMRMPEMSGAEFLAQAYERWPETPRVLLTGYADLESSVAAINEGRIYRYINKPWNDDELLGTAALAIEHKRVKEQKLQLEQELQVRNSELQKLNESLEEKVKARTRDVQKTLNALKKSHLELKQSYTDTIAVFASMIDHREGTSAGQGKLIANFAKCIAEALSLEKAQIEDIYFAGLLHHIGKIGLPDDILNTPYTKLTSTQLEQFHRYPKESETMLSFFNPLKNIADIILCHRERIDGNGFPNKLRGQDISLASRILSLTVEYFEFQNGMLLGEAGSTEEAREFILNNAKNRYGADLVDAFTDVVEKNGEDTKIVKELKLPIQDLKPGMTLAKDISFKTGVLIMRGGQSLTEEQVNKLHQLSEEIDSEVAYVRLEKGDSDG